MKTDPLIAVPETALLTLMAAATRSDADKVRLAVDEAHRRMESFHKGQEEMWEDHAREHLVPEPVTTRAVAFDPAPYLEEAKRLEAEDK